MGWFEGTRLAAPVETLGYQNSEAFTNGSRPPKYGAYPFWKDVAPGNPGPISPIPLPAPPKRCRRCDERREPRRDERREPRRERCLRAMRVRNDRHLPRLAVAVRRFASRRSEIVRRFLTLRLRRRPKEAITGFIPQDILF